MNIFIAAKQESVLSWTAGGDSNNLRTQLWSDVSLEREIYLRHDVGLNPFTIR